MPSDFDKYTSIISKIIHNHRIADTHCHLHDERLKPYLVDIFKNCQQAGVEEIWLVSTDRPSAEENIRIVSSFQKRFSALNLRLGIGFDMELLVPGSEIFNTSLFRLDPDRLADHIAQSLKYLTTIATDKELEVDLVGEVGLDHYWLDKHLQSGQITREDYLQSKKLQQVLLDTQIQFAAEQQLPLSVHSRGAEAETISRFELASLEYKDLQVIFHSFTGNVALFNKILEQKNFYLGVNGIITYKSAADIRDRLIRKICLQMTKHNRATDIEEFQTNWDRRPAYIRQDGHNLDLRNKLMRNILQSMYELGIFLETDAPYLIPTNFNDYHRSQATRDSQRLNSPAAIRSLLEYIQRQVQLELKNNN